MRTEPSAILAIDIGATHTRLALVRDGAIAARVVSPTAALIGPDGSVVDALLAAARAVAGEADAPGIEAVGVGLAAFVDADGGVLQAREFGIPQGGVIRDGLAGAFRVPVAVDNDANVAALAEYRLGVAAGRGTVAVITLGTNIGLGLIIDGRIHRGAHGAAGEAGLLLIPVRDVTGATAGRRLVDAGPLGRAPSAAPAGYAHIEELVGGGALAAAAASEGAPGVSGPFGDGARSATPVASQVAPPRVLTRRTTGGRGADPLADRAVEGWALLIAELSALLDPDLVVLTGGLAQDAAHLLEPLRRRVAELAPLQPEIRLGSVGVDAELLGADLLARSALGQRAVGHARAGLAAQSRGGDR